jgi:transcriptional regulator with XRE-family HTH domain
MIVPAQIGAGRALLDWRQVDLANASGVSDLAIKNVERCVTQPHAKTLYAITTALEKAGVIFVDENGEGSGVRLKKKAKRK